MPIVKRRVWIWGGILVSLLTHSTVALAQVESGPVAVSKPLIMMGVLAVLALAPFIVMMATSFVKLAVVFALLRSALGTQQIPPNQIITGLALILSIYVMIPVGTQIYTQAQDVINTGTNQPILSQVTMDMMGEAVEKGKEPVREFLLKHVHPREQELFYRMARKLQKDPERRELITKTDLISLVPAFTISELTEAFQIGFVIFLPFLIIDLVVANVLLSLGMFQVSPITISLPFKLLMFVLVDGWYLIVRGLIQGYV